MSKIYSKNTRREFLYRVGGSFIGNGILRLALPYTLFHGTNSFAQELQTQNLITFSFPNGCAPEYWNYGSALTPLANLREFVTVLQGIQNPASQTMDAHEQGGVSLFTGGAFIDRNEVFGSAESIDQIASRKLNINAPLQESLVTGVARGEAGGQDRRTSWFRRSWKRSTDGNIRAVTPLVDPNKIFRKIGFDPHASKTPFERAKDKSILDELLVHYRALSSPNSNLSQISKTQLKEHFEHLRSIELKIQRTNAENAEIAACRQSLPGPNIGFIADKPEYSQFESVFDLQVQLSILALKCGITHTASLMFGSAGEEYTNPSISAMRCHQCSHWPEDNPTIAQQNIAEFIKFRQFYMAKIASMINQLRSITFPDSSNLLQKTLLIAGTEFGESNKHVRNPQPLLYAGGSNLKLNQVQNLNRNSNDVYHTILDALGVEVDSVGQPDIKSNIIQDLLKG